MCFGVYLNIHCQLMSIIVAKIFRGIMVDDCWFLNHSHNKVIMYIYAI